MAQRQPRQTAMNGGPRVTERAFPADAYEYEADVTPAGVKQMQDKFGVDVEGDDWELVDGFGRVLHA